MQARRTARREFPRNLGLRPTRGPNGVSDRAGAQVRNCGNLEVCLDKELRTSL